MKTLKFAEPLPKLVLSGEKNTTWRVNDEKILEVGDFLALLRKKNLTEFAKAKIIYTNETTFGELTEYDKEGHEKFNSEKEMHKTYSKYYSINVTPKTPLKIIKFKLID